MDRESDEDCRRPRLAILAVLAVAVLFAAGCTSSTETSADETSAESDGGEVENLPSRAAASGFPAGIAHLDGLEGTEVADPQRLASSAEEAGLSPAQVAALSDGVVEFAEYEELFRDFVECAAARSIVLHEPGLVNDSFLDLDLFGYGIPDIPGEGPPDGEVAECMTRHVYAAEELYVAQNQRPLDEQRDLEEAGFRDQYECYVEQGAQLPFSIDDVLDHRHDLLSLIDTYPDCGFPF